MSELRVELPQLRDGPGPERLVVEGPGIELLSAGLQERAGPETRWLVRIRAGGPPGQVPIVLRALFADDRSVEVDSALTVVPAAAAEPSPVAGVVVGVLLAAGFAAAALRLGRRKA